MANDADTLRGYVESALQDTGNATWSDADIDSLVVRAVASLYPRVVMPLEHLTTNLVAGLYTYALPTSMVSLAQVWWVDTSGTERGQLANFTIEGSLLRGTARLRYPPAFVDGNVGATVRLLGYARYGLTSPYQIPDDYVPYVVAHAKAAAYSWALSARARFKQWANSDQTLNISVNELLGLQAQAEREVEMHKSRIFTWRKPLPAR